MVLFLKIRFFSLMITQCSSKLPFPPGGIVLLWRRRGIASHKSAHVGGSDVSCTRRAISGSKKDMAGPMHQGLDFGVIDLSLLSCSGAIDATHQASDITLPDCLSVLLQLQSSPGMSVEQCAVGALLAARLSMHGLRIRRGKPVRSGGDAVSSICTEQADRRALAAVSATLMDRMEGCMIALDKSLTPAHLVDLAWSRGAVYQANGRQKCRSWWNELTQALRPELMDLPPSNLIKLLWGCATANVEDASFGAALLSSLENCFGNLRTQDLIIIIWAAARFKVQPSPTLRKVLLSEMEAHLHLIKRTQIITLINSLAKVREFFN